MGRLFHVRGSVTETALSTELGELDRRVLCTSRVKGSSDRRRKSVPCASDSLAIYGSLNQSHRIVSLISKVP